jgi:hypothetical protein
MIDDNDCGAVGVLNEWQGTPKYPEKTCPSDVLSTTDLTWLDTGSNPGHRGEKPTTNHQSYFTV